MGIISKDAVQEILSPHQDSVLACVEEAWKRCRDQVLPLMPRARRRYRANAMAGLIESQARARFGSDPRIQIVDQGQRFLLGVKGRFLLHFKHMDAERRTHNILTRTAIRFRGQLPLADFGDIPRVTVGYRLSSLRERLAEVVVFFAVADKVQWEYTLAGDARVHQLEFAKGILEARKAAQNGTTHAAPALGGPGAAPAPGRRVRVKDALRPDSKKVGTEDEGGGA